MQFCLLLKWPMTECHDQQDVCFLTILNNATSCGGKTKINLLIIDYIRWQHTRAIVPSNKIMQILIECTFTWEPLTQWGLDKMAGISQTTLSEAFSWIEMVDFNQNWIKPSSIHGQVHILLVNCHNAMFIFFEQMNSHVLLKHQCNEFSSIFRHPLNYMTLSTISLCYTVVWNVNSIANDRHGVLNYVFFLLFVQTDNKETSKVRVTVPL